MLKKTTYTLCLLAISAIGYSSLFYSSLPPQGHTGAEGQNCSNCHGNLNNGGGSVSVTGLPTSYTPGTPYNFSLNISHGAANRTKWGFSIKAVNSAGQTIGTFTENHPNAAINGSELSHSNAASTSAMSSYTYNNLTWTSPANPGTSNTSVTFYYSGNAANGDFSSGGDFIYTGVTTVPLPITLSGFSANVSGTSVMLKWETSSESNSKNFVIEKGFDNQHFYETGVVNAAGTSSSTRNYSYTDDKPAYFEKPTFYRLVLVDKDGSKKYSNIVNVTLKATSTFVKKIYPNPLKAGSVMQVEVVCHNDENATFQIINIAGSKLQQQSSSLKAGNNVIDIPLNKNVAAGRYTLVVQINGIVQQIPVMIQ